MSEQYLYVGGMVEDIDREAAKKLAVNFIYGSDNTLSAVHKQACQNIPPDEYGCTTDFQMLNNGILVFILGAMPSKCPLCEGTGVTRWAGPLEPPESEGE